MNNKNNEKIKKIKIKLIEKKKSIIAQLQKFATKNKKIKDDYKTDFPNLGDHADENAVEVSDYTSKLSVEHDLESELKNIEGALKKTSENSYGICSVCGEQINPKRLEVMPEANLCIKCSEKSK
ncbi:MAG: TraR/DksA family transcriptional regulator [Candidatus Pacebacteria bacterium]|nr:TraR/DksA family transcriptional regulator [Candidatus Paceibacterota bacterium]